MDLGYYFKMGERERRDLNPKRAILSNLTKIVETGDDKEFKDFLELCIDAYIASHIPMNEVGDARGYQRLHDAIATAYQPACVYLDSKREDGQTPAQDMYWRNFGWEIQERYTPKTSLN